MAKMNAIWKLCRSPGDDALPPPHRALGVAGREMRRNCPFTKMNGWWERSSKPAAPKMKVAFSSPTVVASGVKRKRRRRWAAACRDTARNTVWGGPAS